MSGTSARSFPVRFSDNAIYSREWLASHPDAIEAIIASSGGARPRCMCTKAGVELYVAHREHAYLATMPGRKHHHSVLCPYFEPNPETTGLSAYSERALHRRQGGYHVRLGEEHSGGSIANGGAVHALPHMSAFGVLQLLWDISRLHYWSPAMEGKRNVGLVAWLLSRAAQQINVDGQLLSSCLRTKALDSTTSISEETRFMLGRVRTVFKTRYGVGLRLPRTPFPFWVSQSVLDTAPRSRSVLESLLPPESSHERGHAYVVLEGLRAGSNGLSATRVGAIEVTPSFLPVFGQTDPARLAELQASRTHFFRCLPYDSPTATLPFCVVQSADSAPAPLWGT